MFNAVSVGGQRDKRKNLGKFDEQMEFHLIGDYRLVLRDIPKIRRLITVNELVLSIPIRYVIFGP